METPIITIEELDAMPPIDAEAYHALVCNRIGGHTETYDEVKGDWPDFEGGADPIAEAAGMTVLFNSNDGGDTFFNKQMQDVYDTYAGDAQENEIEPANTARVYELFRDHPMVHAIVFTDTRLVRSRSARCVLCGKARGCRRDCINALDRSAANERASDIQPRHALRNHKRLV